MIFASRIFTRHRLAGLRSIERAFGSSKWSNWYIYFFCAWFFPATLGPGFLYIHLLSVIGPDHVFLLNLVFGLLWGTVSALLMSTFVVDAWFARRPETLAQHIQNIEKRLQGAVQE